MIRALLLVLVLATPVFGERRIVPHSPRHAAVVQVECPLGSGSFCNGSAMLLDQWHALTAHHCIRARSITVFVPQRVTADVIAINVRNDWALLRFRQPIRTAIPVRVRETDVETGEILFGYGFGKARGRFGITPGVFRGAFIEGGPVEEGDSGGPILDSQGRLVGVCTDYTVGTAQWRGHAVGTKSFRDFLALRNRKAEGVEVTD